MRGVRAFDLGRQGGDRGQYRGWNENSVWCRGTDPAGHWANHPRPPDSRFGRLPGWAPMAAAARPAKL